MRYILQLILFAFLIYFLRRLIAVFAKPSNKASKSNNVAPASGQMVKDPVCGMYMDPRLAIKLEQRNEVVHFCSEECKNKYINNPSGGDIGSASAG